MSTIEDTDATRPNEKIAEDALASSDSTTLMRISGDYPVGAFKAWSTVLGAWLLQFGSVGILTSFGVFQDFYTTTWLKNVSASNISWIGSVQLFLELACGPIGGKLFDTGHCRAVVLVGSILFVFNFFMLSLAKQNQYYQAFLSQGVGMGIGCSFIFIPTTTVVSQHFKSRRAFAMGLVISSGSLGGVIFSIMLNKLLHGSAGFAWGVRATAFLTLACFALGNILLFPIIHEKPEQMHAMSSSTHEAKTARLWDIKFVLLLICAFLCSLGLYFPLFYLQLFAEKHGIDKNLSFYSIAILNASGMFGRIGPNALADRFGGMNMFAICLTLNGFISFAMLGAKNTAGLIAFAIFYGFFFGATISVYFPAVMSLGTEGVNVGKRVGIALVPVGLAYLVGSPISGLVIGTNFEWWKGIVFASVTMLGSVSFLVAIKMLQLKDQQKGGRTK